MSPAAEATMRSRTSLFRPPVVRVLCGPRGEQKAENENHRQHNRTNNGEHKHGTQIKKGYPTECEDEKKAAPGVVNEFDITPRLYAHALQEFVSDLEGLVSMSPPPFTKNKSDSQWRIGY